MGFVSDLFGRKTIGAEGQDLARRFAKRLAPESVRDAKRVAAEFDILAGHALGYQRKAGLGVIGKSHLVNSFQWALIEAGYAPEFAKDMGNKLAVKLAGTG